MTHGLFLVYPGSLYLLVDQSLFEIIFSFSSHARIKLVFPSPNIRTEADLGGGCSGCAPPPPPVSNTTGVYVWSPVSYAIP